LEILEERQLLSGTPWPTHISAPYVDTTLYPTFDLAAAEQSTGNRYYTLAFVNAGSTDEPAWGGQDSLSVASGYMSSQISALRALGGDVIVSFGGADGTELAEAITNVTTLQAAYQQVVREYDLTRLDFDIEGAAAADSASIDRRSEAIAGLQQAATSAGQTLQIWLTLPVLPSGLTADGLYVVQSALAHGVNLSGVNIMAMDFGENAAPNPAGQMGTYSIEAAQSTFTQLQSIYASENIGISSAQLWQKMGITPMIGVNDATDEVFEQSDADQVLAFAQQKNIGELAFWSATRDQEPPAGQYGEAVATNSGIMQTPSQFTEIFEAYDAASTPGLEALGSTVDLTGTNTMTASFSVYLLPAATQAVTVHYTTVDQTARAGYDYVATSGTLSFAAGVTEQTINVPVLPNPATSTSSDYFVELSDAVGAPIYTAQATGNIVKIANTLSATATYETTSDWDSGYNGEIDITNTGTTTILPWELSFELPTSISDLWNGTVASQTGNAYVVDNPSWGDAIDPGQTVSIGFGAAPGDDPPAPTNFVLNGVPLGVTNLTLAAGGSNWTSAGLTLKMGSDDDDHIYTTGTTTDAISPMLPAAMAKVAVQGPGTAASQLTVDFSSGDPIPSGGATFTGQSGSKNQLLLTGTPAGENVTLSGSQLTVGSDSVISLANVAFIGINAGGTGTSSITGTTGLFKSGPSTLILSGTAAYGGPTTDSEGMIEIDGAAAFPTGSALIIGAAGSNSSVAIAQESAEVASPVATASTAASDGSTGSIAEPDRAGSTSAIVAPGFVWKRPSLLTGPWKLAKPTNSSTTAQSPSNHARLFAAAWAAYQMADPSASDRPPLLPSAIDALLAYGK
jgi:chitinase